MYISVEVQNYLYRNTPEILDRCNKKPSFFIVHKQYTI